MRALSTEITTLGILTTKNYGSNMKDSDSDQKQKNVGEWPRFWNHNTATQCQTDIVWWLMSDDICWGFMEKRTWKGSNKENQEEDSPVFRKKYERYKKESYLFLRELQRNKCPQGSVRFPIREIMWKNLAEIS